MKILADFGQVIEIKYKRTFYEPDSGWDTIRMMPEVYIDGVLKFTGTEVDCTGCSRARAIGNRAMVKECFAWIVDNCVG